MKPLFQIAVSAFALSGLLYAGASGATALSELPLKANIQYKPNVIFGQDNSGSMDWEVLLSNDEGKLRWNGTTFWDSANNRFLKSSTVAEFSQLFPYSSGSGSTGTDTMPGGSVPPTPQFAALRSGDYHGLYYNPAITYEPWSKSNNGTTTTTWPNVSIANATAGTPSVRAPVAPGSTTTVELMGSRQWQFTLLPGMVNPSTGTAVTSNTTVTMTYYPATYWKKEDCGTVNGTSCVWAPEGSPAKLKRYEIKRADYASDAAFKAAIQNFANWFTYYRKRYLMLNGAMGEVLEGLTGLRVGVVKYWSHSAPTMYDLDSTDPKKNGLRVNGAFYSATPGGGTPTLATLKYIGDRFSADTTIIQAACQRNNAFILTDGFYNGTAPTSPTATTSPWGVGAPYATTKPNSMADLALAYYTNNPRPDLAAGRVAFGAPGPNQDKNTNLHVNTYAMTLNVSGNLWPAITDPFATAITWPNPVADTPSAIDDIWHATINGRGKMYQATSPENTKELIRAGLNDILSQTASQGGVAVTSVNLARGDGHVYMGIYDPAGWKGDLFKKPIDSSTGAISTTAVWNAGAKLNAKDWTKRVIFGSDGTNGMAFTAANFGAQVNPDTTTFTDNAVVVDYLRGNRAGEASNYRMRASLMGAVVNAKPVVAFDERTAYVASGEGMLHAIDTDTGQERWAFVPYHNLAGVGRTIERGYAYQTALDGTPAVGTIGSAKLLVAGMGAAGRGYYALDVTNPAGVTEDNAATTHRWTFPKAGDTANQALMGYTVGKPVIIKAWNNNYYVLVTSGYDNAQTWTGKDGRGRMWMLDALSGTVVKTFDTGVGTASAEAGLAHLTAYGEDDGTVKFVYGGDLLGNLWRFNLETGSTTRVANFSIGSVAQPITAAPDVMDLTGKKVILVGTGRMLDVTDFGNTNTQSIYAISDGDGTLPTLTTPRTTLRTQTYNAATRTLTNNAVDWADNKNRGWYFDLPAGEQANTPPIVGFGNVAFVTNKTGQSDCSASSALYVVDVKNGSAAPGSTVVSYSISTKSNSSAADLVQTRDGRLKIEVVDYDGNPTPKDFGSLPSIDPRKNAWREVRPNQ